jgi:hypothetical protein
MQMRVALSFVYLVFGFTLSTRALAAEEGQAPAEATPPAAAEPTPETAPAPAPEVATPAPAPVAAPAVAPAPAPSGPPSFKITSADGSSSIKLGLLFQPQFQSASSPTLDKYSNNFYLRRMRLLLGGTVLGAFEYFVETDFANMFLASPGVAADGSATYSKSTPGMNIQDAFATWRAYNDMAKIDVGYMLPPLAHNALQGATTLLSWDYYAFSFRHSDIFGSSASPVGRDVGVQLRGMLLDGMLEYRAGLYQGLRQAPTATEVGARNFFRFAARVQVNLLDPESGFFYAGTYLGKKKVLSFGGSIDIQDEYKYFAGDAFADLPVGPAGVLTAQVDVAHWDGKNFLPIPKQTAVMGEAGFLISAAQISPIVRVEHLSGSGIVLDQDRYSGGLAYWAYGHNSNIKLFYSRMKTKGAARGINQINLQWQLFIF